MKEFFKKYGLFILAFLAGMAIAYAWINYANKTATNTPPTHGVNGGQTITIDTTHT